jgi:hypothetical protein
MKQNELNEYFNNIWRYTPFSDLKAELSGYVLVDKIKPNETVLDVGCGKNLFKGKIPNLIGIDPAFKEADYNLSLEDFVKVNTDKYDVAFCLGSINFGDREQIESQIELLIGILNDKNRIYWRCNPGLYDHENEECKRVPFYPWTIEEHVRLSNKYGYKLIECRWESNNRIYSEWSR